MRATALRAMGNSGMRNAGQAPGMRRNVPKTALRVPRTAVVPVLTRERKRAPFVIGAALPSSLLARRRYLLGQFRQGPVIFTAIRASSLFGFTSLLAVAHPNSYMRRSCLFPATALSVIVILALAPGARSP